MASEIRFGLFLKCATLQRSNDCATSVCITIFNVKRDSFGSLFLLLLLFYHYSILIYKIARNYNCTNCSFPLFLPL